MTMKMYFFFLSKVDNSSLSPSRSPLKKKAKRYIGFIDFNVFMSILHFKHSNLFQMLARSKRADRSEKEACKRKLDLDVYGLII